jgi:hypothetical protein
MQPQSLDVGVDLSPSLAVMLDTLVEHVIGEFSIHEQ